MASSTVPPTGECFLSFGQQALWFMQSLAPESSFCNVSFALALDFDVDVAAFRSAALAVVAMNSMLNCLFRPTPAGLRRLPGAVGRAVGLLDVLLVAAQEDVSQLPEHVMPPGSPVRVLPLPQQQGQFDLTLQLTWCEMNAFLVLKHNTSLFSSVAARTLVDEYLRFLAAVADGSLPERLGDLTSTLCL